MPIGLEDAALQAWHRDEEAWWESNGAYMTFQWQLTPRMSQAIRNDLESDYKSYLLQPGGCLLDLGCGSGWLSRYFAERGMRVHGLDISAEQVSAATAMAAQYQLNDATFEVADFSRWDATSHLAAFDSVFVSAFLHHLPEVELRSTLEKIASVVKKGGRIYLYEPLQSGTSRTMAAKVIDRIYNLYLKLLLDTLPNHLGWWSDRHKSELSRGYTMTSPHEAPVSLEVLESACHNHFELLETRGWHLNSLGFGMQSMGIKERVRRYYEPLAALSYRIDRQLMGRMGWRAFSTPGRFILVGIKMIRL